MRSRAVALWLALAATAGAHIGSPDVFFEGKAGAYPLTVTIRPPAVIPGVAEIEIRTSANDVREVRITPTPLVGLGAKFAPVPDLAVRSKQDPQYFTGALWMMSSGSWQVRVRVDGERGAGNLAVPVPAIAKRTTEMQAALGAILGVLMAILVVGIISIVGAASREGQLEPGQTAPPANRRRARIAMAATAIVVALGVWGGNNWWTAEASNYARIIYKPLGVKAEFESGKLVLRLQHNGWFQAQTLDDFIPDHNHLMHMYLIRLPDMERVWHLHPEMTSGGVFTHELPPVPAGRYQIYGDLVHRSGFPETVAAEIDLPEIAGKPLAGDDSAGLATPLSAARKDIVVAPLSGGFRMIWEREPTPLKTRQLQPFRFRIESPDGKPVQDLELYMGMPGHAAFVRADRTVFAHVHPSGSVPMAALALAEQNLPAAAADPHAGHAMEAALPAVVSFPYGFPQPGDYRIFVQVKRAGKVEMGIFDTRVEN